jgi:hypothetical protein
LRWCAADFDYRCEANHLTSIASPLPITVNLGKTRPIDQVTSQLRHSGILAIKNRQSRDMEWQGRSGRAARVARRPYMVEAVDKEAPALSPDDEAGIEAALESNRQGRVVDGKRARQIIDAALGR